MMRAQEQRSQSYSTWLQQLPRYGTALWHRASAGKFTATSGNRPSSCFIFHMKDQRIVA